MKPIKEYKWKAVRENSKGETVWRHDTDEGLEEVTDYLNKNNIKYEVKGRARMLKIHYETSSYAYYYTTGRWSPYITGSFPKKHYHSKGIEDFINRFIKGIKNETH